MHIYILLFFEEFLYSAGYFDFGYERMQRIKMMPIRCSHSRFEMEPLLTFFLPIRLLYFHLSVGESFMKFVLYPLFSYFILSLASLIDVSLFSDVLSVPSIYLCLGRPNSLLPGGHHSRNCFGFFSSFFLLT